MANINQSKLTPTQQALLFQLSKSAGNQPTSGGAPIGQPGNYVEDPQAQVGTGPVDASQLQGLFNPQPAQAPQLQQQPGDQMHPQAAIQSILGGQLKVKGNDLYKTVPNLGPLGLLFGKKTVDVRLTDPTNYANLAQKAGITLPENLPRMPNGTPFVDAQQFKLLAATNKPAISNTPVTKQEFMALGGSQDQADQLYGKGDAPGVTQPLNKLGLLPRNMMAESRKSLAGTAANKFEATLGQQFQKAISDAEASPQSQLGQASNILTQATLLRNSLINRRYDPSTDTYDFNPTEYGELALGAARILTRRGAMTNEQLDQVKQDTGMDRLARIAGFLGVSAQAAPDQIGRRLVALVDNEGLAASNVRDLYVSQNMPAYDALKKLNPAYYNNILNQSYGGVDYAQLLANSKDTQSENYQMPNVVPVTRTTAPGQTVAPNYKSSVPGVGNPLPAPSAPNVRAPSAPAKKPAANKNLPGLIIH